MQPRSRAALYLRSSKDRKDVSTQDQRELLTRLAAERGLDIVTEFVDVVESGRDEDRPGLQAMLGAITQADRGWNRLLVRDTARLSRAGWIDGLIDYEVHKHGVEIVYANIPDVDAMTQIMLRAVYRAQDQIHSMMSRDKGLAGMRQNVQRGYRAGGRAPWGYRLRHVGQGLVRDGRELTKTVLEPGPAADQAARYLQLRSEGIPRVIAVQRTGVTLSPATLVGVEWNALTYAGCTVWNVHREHKAGGYGKGGKRRPRAEWEIRPDTHPALITRDQAEKILGRLEQGDVNRRRAEARAAASPHLLSGLLQAPSGETWTVDGPHYRPRHPGGRYVRVEELDQLVMDQVLGLLHSDELLSELAASSTALAQINLEPRKQLQARIAGLNATVSKAMTAALQLEDAGPALRKVDELERERKGCIAQLAELDEEIEMAKNAATIDKNKLQTILADFTQMAEAEDLKLLISLLLEKVTLNPETLECQLHIRLKPSRLNVASPRGPENKPARGFESWPTLRAILGIGRVA